MVAQSAFRMIKRWRRYEAKERFKSVPRFTRGVYVLYKEKKEKGTEDNYEVKYIGIGGISKKGTSGVKGRLENHVKNKPDWTHFSFFEVHDNVSSDEIRELEILLLAIFRRDPRVDLQNKQKGSHKFYKAQGKTAWKDVPAYK